MRAPARVIWLDIVATCLLSATRPVEKRNEPTRRYVCPRLVALLELRFEVRKEARWEFNSRRLATPRQTRRVIGYEKPHEEVVGYVAGTVDWTSSREERLMKSARLWTRE